MIPALSTEHERVEIPCVGSKFPNIEAQTTLGKISLPDHFSGKWFILFTHPGDFTPVCTTEFASFARRHGDFRQLNCELIGLSVDQVYSHIVWKNWIEEKLGVRIEYPIIADSMGKIATRLGSIQPVGSSNALRGIYITDPSAVVRSVLFYPRGIGRNMDELLRIMKALQIEEKYGVAIPANWPDNEFFGDEVFFHPPSTVMEADKRKKAEGCDDWWFCHRKIEDLRK